MTKNLRRLIRLVRQVDRSLSKKWSFYSKLGEPDELRIDGMTPYVQIQVGEAGIMVVARSPDGSGDFFDILCDVDCIPQHQKGKGWRCSLCTDKPPVVFRSKKELWLSHCVLPFFRWAEVKFLPGNFLVFWISEEQGIAWSRIVDETESLRVTSSEGFWKMEPLFIS